MRLTWYGQNCFKIQTKAKRGEKEVTIVTDIFDKKIGLRPPQGQIDIVTLSHYTYYHTGPPALKSQPFIIDAAGEYSLRGIHLEGIESFSDKEQGAQRGRNTIFLMESEGIRLCHLGELGHDLTEDQLEAIGEVDILLVPVGNPNLLSLKDVKSIIGKLEPGIIIPMQYQIKNLKSDLTDCREFCQALGGAKKEDKLNIKSKEVKEMENNVVVLNPA